MLRIALGSGLRVGEVSPEYAAKYLGHGHGTSVLYAHNVKYINVKYINTVDNTGSGALDSLMPPGA